MNPIRSFFKLFRPKNITSPIQVPVPNPCSNSSYVRCLSIALGVTADPHEGDVQNNSTLPCTTTDCNNTTHTIFNEMPNTLVISISAGAFFMLLAFVVLYRKGCFRAASPGLRQHLLAEHNAHLDAQSNRFSVYQAIDKDSNTSQYAIHSTDFQNGDVKNQLLQKIEDAEQKTTYTAEQKDALESVMDAQGFDSESDSASESDGRSSYDPDSP